jgi:uncharacterized membrane protein
MPPNRLVISGLEPRDALPLINWGVAGIVAIGVVARQFASLEALHDSSRWIRRGVVVLGLYAMCVTIVDVFQSRVDSLDQVVDVAKQAQVAVSIALAAVGFGVLLLGTAKNRYARQIGGLAILVAASVKVFVFDLATLDATYRVLSFVGLGVVLLAAGYFYRSIEPETLQTQSG